MLMNDNLVGMEVFNVTLPSISLQFGPRRCLRH